jgi:TRAP-type C4-dicarboxylate transport system permease small subunit
MDVFQRALETLVVILSALMVTLVFSQVILRYVFFYSISWSEEFATISFIWIVLLGAAVGIRKQEHLGINILLKHLPRKVCQILESFTKLIIIAFFFLLFWSSWQVAIANMLRRLYTVDIPVGYVRMVLPGMALFCILFEIELVIKLFNGLLRRKK